MTSIDEEMKQCNLHFQGGGVNRCHYFGNGGEWYLGSFWVPVLFPLPAWG